MRDLSDRIGIILQLHTLPTAVPRGLPTTSNPEHCGRQDDPRPQLFPARLTEQDPRRISLIGQGQIPSQAPETRRHRYQNARLSALIFAPGSTIGVNMGSATASLLTSVAAGLDLSGPRPPAGVQRSAMPDLARRLRALCRTSGPSRQRRLTGTLHLDQDHKP